PRGQRGSAPPSSRKGLLSASIMPTPRAMDRCPPPTIAKGRATRGWPGPSGCCGGTEVRCTAEGSVQVQEGLHDLVGVLVVDLVRTVLVGTDLVLEAGHRLGTDLAVLLGADPVL